MNDMDFILKVIGNIPEDKKKDPEFLKKVDDRNPAACDMMLDTPELKDDKDFAVKSMSTDLASKVYDHLSIELRSDDDVILAALTSRVIEPGEKKEDAPMFFKVEPHDEEVVENPNITFEEKKEEAPMFFGEEKVETDAAPVETVTEPVETVQATEETVSTYPNFDELLPKENPTETVGTESDFTFKNNDSFVADSTPEGMYTPNTEVSTTPAGELPSLEEVAGMTLNESYNSDPAFGGYQNVEQGESLIR